MITNKKTFELCMPGVQKMSMALSIFEERLLFFHNSFTSSQFVLDRIGVTVMRQPTCTKLQIYFLDQVEHSWGFFFESEEHEALVRYFLALGYKNCDAANMQLVDDKAPYNVKDN